ncbi:hypothetical protein RHMOL_Rhmol13G0302500 [Rhododendron molle]|uniref:Uncharacterized protein n=1 Tax=Rhododendron molle TaxID=49168 RepID=A0ACC0LDZ0_RHOML|nr:hypothetical protein RHMOL_Rhmol13G0302500 [Rhododendron molle]
MDQFQDDTSKVKSTKTDEENEAERIRRRRFTGKETVAAEDERRDIDKLAEDFIKKFRSQLKIQQLEFIKHREETIAHES